MTPFICAGCKAPIMERYLMKVLDKSWHVQCVKCSECHCLLSEKCFSRETKLYCRSDFFKLYGTKCAGCNVGLCPEDLVRRAVNKVYHVHCFLCSLCKKTLSTGEQLYLVQSERFLCERCYQLSTQSLVASSTQSVAVSPATTPATATKQETPKHTLPAQTEPPVPHHNHPSTTPSVPSVLSATMGSIGSGGSSDSKKPKTRTSINPQQLEVLLEAYSREQRPSKLMREELMAKTGLDMKVIQVWFQNRRSKEKRDASYREAMKEEHITPPPPLQPTSITTTLPTAVTSLPAATSTVSAVLSTSTTLPLAAISPVNTGMESHMNAGLTSPSTASLQQ